MSSATEISGITSLEAELSSIESLINNILQRQCMLQERLAALEVPCPIAALGTASSCFLLAVENSRKFTGNVALPLFEPIGDEDPLDLPLSNFFVPLSELADGSRLSPLPGPRNFSGYSKSSSRKHPCSLLPIPHQVLQLNPSPGAVFSPQAEHTSPPAVTGYQSWIYCSWCVS